MTFKKKIRTSEEQAKYDEKQERKSPVFTYHYCLNENLPKEHPDFCFNCWVDGCETYSSSQQNWKYCKSCVQDKNFPEFTLKTKDDGYKIHMDMVAHLAKYTNITKEIVRRRDTDNGFGKFINGKTETDLEKVFNEFYPNVKMVRGIYK
jgi:hypothetical protein